MNGKKAKYLRKTVKAMGLDPKETTYRGYHPPTFMSFAFNSEGKFVPSIEGTHYRKVGRGVPRLLATCGREAYQGLKKVEGGVL